MLRRGGRLEVKVLTRNEEKLREFRELGSEYGIEVVEVGLPKKEIQAETLEEVALYSAANASPLVKGLFFAEDAGLFIDALKGFPGVYSAYVLKTIGVSGILKLMEGVQMRDAFFKSVIALRVPGEGIKIFRGEVKGGISFEARGSGGFGFDPIFVPEGEIRTFAEMSVREKNMFSHRAAAFRAMADWLRTTFKP